MGVDKTTCGFPIFFRCLLMFLHLDIPANAYPLQLYPGKESNRRNFLPPTFETLDVDDMDPMDYELDAWSQYENPEEGSAREGDIKRNEMSRKTTTTDPQLLWPDGKVPYFVDESIVNEPSKLAILEDAMENIMELTCVKFVRIYPSSKTEFPTHTWLNVTGYDNGCFSDIGRSAYGPSNMNLDLKKCFRTRGHAIHEILHTLGVFHEHMRPDRDQHIKILWRNIRKGDAFNFRIMDNNSVTNYGLPYDYDSIMHYSMTAFSKNRKRPTIVPRKRGVKIGQRSHLSFYDVQKILITYKCNTDSEHLYEKINQDKSKNIGLLNFNNASTKSIASVTQSPEKKFGSADSLRDYQLQASKTYQLEAPPMWPFYFNYFDYFPFFIQPNTYYV